MRNIKNSLTIFTPTYNRANEIENLYKSLARQSDLDFVWLVVDDGSTDNTKEKIERWTKESNFKIVYKWQENAGKSIAHNVGVNNTETELFTCVDSDDYLSDSAVEIIKKTWKDHVATDVGILALREVTKLSFETKEKGTRTKLREAEKKCGINGDTMLIFKTDIMRKYRFPKFDGEKFVPENYIYDQIDQVGDLIFLNKVLYYGNYLMDGYTRNMAKVIKNNPNGYLCYIEQRIQLDDDIMEKCKDIIRYIAVSKTAKKRKIVVNSNNPMLTLLMYPLGLVFYYIRYARI